MEWTNDDQRVCGNEDAGQRDAGRVALRSAKLLVPDPRIGTAGQEAELRSAVRREACGLARQHGQAERVRESLPASASAAVAWKDSRRGTGLLLPRLGFQPVRRLHQEAART